MQQQLAPTRAFSWYDVAQPAWMPRISNTPLALVRGETITALPSVASGIVLSRLAQWKRFECRGGCVHAHAPGQCGYLHAGSEYWALGGDGEVLCSRATGRGLLARRLAHDTRAGAAHPDRADAAAHMEAWPLSAGRVVPSAFSGRR